MGNMAYCKFENTYNDLQDCYEIIANSNEPLSSSEEEYKKKLIKLCKDVALDFADTIPFTPTLITKDELG